MKYFLVLCLGSSPVQFSGIINRPFQMASAQEQHRSSLLAADCPSPRLLMQYPPCRAVRLPSQQDQCTTWQERDFSLPWASQPRLSDQSLGWRQSRRGRLRSAGAVSLSPSPGSATLCSNPGGVRSRCRADAAKALGCVWFWMTSLRSLPSVAEPPRPSPV